MNEHDIYNVEEAADFEELLDTDEIEEGNPQSWTNYYRDHSEDPEDTEPEEPTNGELDWEQLRRVGLRYARKFNLPHGEEEDIVQICLKKLYIKIKTVEKPYGYMRRTVAYECLNAQRSHNFSQRSSSAFPEAGDRAWKSARTVGSVELRFIKPGSPVHDLIQQENIMTALASVSSAHQALFLHYLAGYDSKRLADMFGYASDRSVNQTLTRIKTQLREEFQDPDLFRN